MTLPMHFTEEDYAERRRRVRDKMAERGLDGLLIFRQESMFYLTGYDTFGYVFFQCLYLGTDGRMVLLTRSADRLQAERTSLIEDIRVWVDGPDAAPAEMLRDILREYSAADSCLGVEYEAYGLTARNGKRLEAALQGFCTLEDASLLVSELRVIKSDKEIAYTRRAGELADDAWQAALDTVAPGADEGEILAAMQGAIFKGGGDYPGNEFIIGSGPGALLCRYYSGRRRLDPQDQITLEWAGAYRHYHVAMMRTIPVGTAPQRQIDMHSLARDALLAVEERLRPGSTFGEAFGAHAKTFDAAGMSEYRLNACGYSLGTTFAPNWMDWPMLYRDNPVEIRPGMVIFCHMILFDSDRGLAMTLGRTSLVGKEGSEPLSKASLDLVTA
jgi:Xaa-Pro dipeptidase